MTPRQLAAWSRLIEKDVKRERATLLNIAALGARGEWKEVQKLVREWGR